MAPRSEGCSLPGLGMAPRSDGCAPEPAEPVDTLAAGEVPVAETAVAGNKQP